MKPPKEKAMELIERFIQQTRNKNDKLAMSYQRAKMCALIAIDEIIKSNYKVLSGVKPSFYNYWQEVKQEIEKS